eukprot:349961-Chlamydomonas_euryale.AAC.15
MDVPAPRADSRALMSCGQQAVGPSKQERHIRQHTPGTCPHHAAAAAKSPPDMASQRRRNLPA